MKTIITVIIVLLGGRPAATSAVEFCRICGDGPDEAFLPDKRVSIPAYDFIETCQTLNRTAASILIEGSPECDQVQSLGTFCGCQVQANPCRICGDDDDIDPDFDLTTEIPFIELSGISPTCELYVAYVANLDADDPICKEMQVFGSYCGCKPAENHCELCPGEQIQPEYLDQELGFLGYYLGDEEIAEGIAVLPTCQFLETTLLQVDRGDYWGCRVPTIFNYLCGCNNGFRAVNGADTVKKRTVILWLPRVSAILSLLGSLAVLASVIKVRIYNVDRTRHTFYPIMLALACCDICNSIAWIIGPSATPATLDGDDAGVPGAIGNEASCNAQAWLVHFGYGCCLYTVSLAIYFKLMIVDDWKEVQLARIRKYLIGLPLLVALALAMAGIPHTTAYPYGCSLALYPLEQHVWENLFVILPVGLSTTAIFYMMLCIYMKVRRVTRSPASAGATSVIPRHAALERKAFWQATLYVVAYIITWPASASCMLYVVATGDAPYPVYLIGLTLAPVQGLSNALVYFSDGLGVICCWCRAKSGPDGEIHAPSPDKSSSICLIGTRHRC